MTTAAGGWMAIQTDSGPQVFPLDDLRPHLHDSPCWCSPTDDEGVLVHHSVDRREEFEHGRKAS